LLVQLVKLTLNYLYFSAEESDRGTVFTPCVIQAVFGWFSANSASGAHNAREHANFTTSQNFLHGTRKELYMYFINQFSLPAATVLDMTDSQGTDMQVYI